MNDNAPLEFGSITELETVLNTNGWTEVSWPHLDQYATRGGVLAVIFPSENKDAYYIKAVRVERVESERELYQFSGALTSNPIDMTNVVCDDNERTRVFWSPGEIIEHHPKAGDTHTEQPPADPFGDDPTRTQALAAKHLLDTWIEAGFTREEAMQFVLQIHQDELDHYSQHCLTNHVNSGEQWGQYDQDDDGEQHG